MNSFIHLQISFIYRWQEKKGQEVQESLGGSRPGPPGLLCVTLRPDLGPQDCVHAFILRAELLIMGSFHKLMMQLVEMGFLYAK